MFYIGLRGGLGNQLFQYAFALSASKQQGIPFAFDLHYYEHQPKKDTPREYLLHHFNIEAPIATATDTSRFHNTFATYARKIRRRFVPQHDYVYNPKQLRVSHNQYLEGFWQSEKYFSSYASLLSTQITLKEPLTPSADAIAQAIQHHKEQGIITVLLHIRRGDYVTNPSASAFHGAQTTEYYAQALTHIESLISTPFHIYITTDDITWTKEHIHTSHPVTYISNPLIPDYQEFMLMSACDHFIISNSSFSWWPAWLGSHPKKIVIAPKSWVKDPSVPTPDIIPDSWITI